MIYTLVAVSASNGSSLFNMDDEEVPPVGVRMPLAAKKNL